jgi:hypothetical protein
MCGNAPQSVGHPGQQRRLFELLLLTWWMLTAAMAAGTRTLATE